MQEARLPCSKAAERRQPGWGCGTSTSEQTYSQRTVLSRVPDTRKEVGSIHSTARHQASTGGRQGFREDRVKGMRPPCAAQPSGPHPHSKGPGRRSSGRSGRVRSTGSDAVMAVMAVAAAAAAPRRTRLIFVRHFKQQQGTLLERICRQHSPGKAAVSERASRQISMAAQL